MLPDISRNDSPATPRSAVRWCRRIAYHAAGQAVVQARLGRGVYGVPIVAILAAGDSQSKRTPYSGPLQQHLADAVPYARMPRELRAEFEAHVIATFAGFIAESRSVASEPRGSKESDQTLLRIRDRVRRVLPDDQAQDFFADQALRARALVEENWDQVEKVAAVLMDREPEQAVSERDQRKRRSGKAREIREGQPLFA